MTYLDNFNRLVGETIMYCQRIEHDIKIIYAAMLSGDMQENLNLVSRETLGSVLVALKALDNSDNDPVFTENDYRLLKEIKNIRNFIAHQCYVDFLYLQDENFTQKLSQNHRKIEVFNNNLQNLSILVEKARFSVLSKFRRI